ncbi:hypothetical protein C7M61_000815 [Candidozyma pseudohaemuli]|uniref:PH domain-containing protein n=1 Tax=Candidozyma pseudohaemuli TaxID=418784 RepID=A0A2P7YYV2_9ASCO|nr:hypothetical protein C7M61_000815 [[Candida] pseudohaemulonii]PSK41143.1 hypothetical protein C7M61_000815 [[Candida] pseudohaemulonii]
MTTKVITTGSESEIANNVETQFDDNKVVFLSWVQKRSFKTHQWNKRWMVLRNCQLSYYKKSSEHKPSKVLNKSELLAFSDVQDAHKEHENHFAIYTSSRVYHFRVESKQLQDSWMKALESVVRQYEDDSNEDEEHETAASHLSNLLKDKREGEYLVEQGELRKLRKRYSQWRKLYVVVTNKAIYFCKLKEHKDRAYKIIKMDNVMDVIEVDATRGKSWCIMVITPMKRIYLGAQDEHDMTKWLSAIKAVVLLKKRN